MCICLGPKEFLPKGTVRLSPCPLRTGWAVRELIPDCRNARDATAHEYGEIGMRAPIDPDNVDEMRCYLFNSIPWTADF